MPNRKTNSAKIDSSSGLLTRSWFFVGLALVALVAAIFAAVIIVQRRVQESGAQLAPAVDLSFVETFDTDILKDGAETTANWDTAAGTLTLPDSGDFFETDGTALGADSSISALIPGTNVTDTYSLVLDGLGFPHIVWANGGVYYSFWDGIKWTGLDPSDGFASLDLVYDPTSYPFGPAGNVGLALKPSGDPMMVWDTPGAGMVFYIQWTAPFLTYTQCNGVLPIIDDITTHTAGVSGFFEKPSIAANSAGNPGVTFQDSFAFAGFNQIYYTECNGISPGFWTGADDIDGDGLFGTYDMDPVSATVFPGVFAEESHVNFDSSDAPAVSWNNVATTDVAFTRWDGATWATADLGTSPGADIVRAVNGIAEGGSLEFAGLLPTLAFRGMDGGAPNILVSVFDGASWVNPITSLPGFSNVSGTLTDSKNPSLELSGPLDSYVAWEDSPLGTPQILLSKFDGSSWNDLGGTPGFTNVSATPSVALADSIFPSLELTPAGEPALSFADATGPPPGQAYFTQWMSLKASTAKAQSATVDITGEPIITATLEVEQTLDGGTTLYELSNDGGATWEPVTPSLPHSFTSVGSELLWRVEIGQDAGDTGSTPTIEKITVDYSTAAAAVAFDRFGGSDEVDKSINVSLERFATSGSASAGLIARKDIMADAFVAGPLVNLSRATLLLNDPKTLEPRVLSEFIRALGPSPGKTLYIAGGEEAISADIEADLKEVGFKTKRLGDDNRLGTAARIAEEIISLNPLATTKVIMAEHIALVDALGANAVAGNLASNSGNAVPIILNRRGDSNIDPFTDELLRVETEIVSLELIGGIDALHETLPNTLASKYPNLVSIDRVDGLNRFDTNANLAKKYFVNPTTVVFSAGEKEDIPGARSIADGTFGSEYFFSALLAAPLAGELGAPLLISKAFSLPEEQALYLSDNVATITNLIIVGTESEISKAVEDKILSFF